MSRTSYLNVLVSSRPIKRSGLRDVTEALNRSAPAALIRPGASGVDRPTSPFKMHRFEQVAQGPWEQQFEPDPFTGVFTFGGAQFCFESQKINLSEHSSLPQNN